MLGDPDLIFISRNERASMDLARSERRPAIEVPGPSRNSLDNSHLEPRASSDYSNPLSRASTGSMSSSVASTWGFLGTSPASWSSAPGSYFPASMLARSDSLPMPGRMGGIQEQGPEPQLDKIPRLIRTLSKGLDQFR